jgi:GNAT superfamily N-acetyltransferase
MPNPVEIRLATADDAQAIAGVLRESFLEFKPLYTEGGFAATTPSASQVLIRQREGPVWVGLRRETMAGTVAALLKDASSVYVRGMAVLPTARGTGLGAALLRQVELWAGQNGCSRLTLSTTPFLTSAIRLYESFGYRRIGSGPHDLFGTPLFTMEKLLPPPPKRQSGEAQPSKS